jgi:REDY-like protein HapK
MAQRVFFLNTLRPDVEPADYEAWIQRVDYPIARKQQSIQSYVVTRLEGTLSGEGEPPYQYLEVIEITDLDAYRSGMEGNAEFEQLLAEWATYVGESVAVHGEVIE